MNFYSFVSFNVWLRAMGIYALLTLPVLWAMPLYFISLILAIGWSIPGAVLFALAQPLVSRMHGNAERLLLQLLLAAVLTAGCSLLATLHVSAGVDYWETLLQFFVFPLAAVVAALLGVLSSKHLFNT